MRKTGMKLALLGGFAGAALLAGCGDNPYDYGRKWSLTAQDDYYSDKAQDEVGREYSNLGTSATAFETGEQDRGTGGSGEAVFSLNPEPREGGTGGPGLDERDEVTTRIQGSAQEQEHLWLQQDMRVPYPPSQLNALSALPLGTGRPLRAGPNGAWVQGTYAVELGSGVATSLSTTSGSLEPQEPATGTQSLPNTPVGGQQAPKGQIGQPPAANDQ